MDKYTPGPWQLAYDAVTQQWEISREHVYGPFVLVRRCEGQSITETEANARAISICPEMLSAIDEADTAFAVINMCDDLTPQAKSALREAWAKVQAILVKLSPDGALAEAVKETPTSAYNLMNPSKEAQDQFPLEDWQYEVMNGDTKRGYNEWLAVQLEDCQHTL